MIVQVQAVRPSRRGFVVIWFPQHTPKDMRASVLEMAKMPRGHELLRAGAQVELMFNADGHVALVRAAR